MAPSSRPKDICFLLYEDFSVHPKERRSSFLCVTPFPALAHATIKQVYKIEKLPCSLLENYIFKIPMIYTQDIKKILVCHCIYYSSVNLSSLLLHLFIFSIFIHF